MDLKSKNVIDLRREFHQIPEPGWLEFQTTVKIIDYLKDSGFDLKYGKKIHGSQRMGLPTAEESQKYKDSLNLTADYDLSEILQGYTGVVATFDTKREGPTIALRFDIDALFIEESGEADHLPQKEGFRSKNKSAMHACGHDGHISIGLNFAKWIMENKDRLKGKYTLIFQPAEEGVRGAKSMVEAGVVDGVDYLLAGHIGLGSGQGVLSVGSQGFFATTKMDIYFEGVPAHAAANPEHGRNALLAAASCALNLYTLTQFSAGMSRLNVGILRAGSSRNIIANHAMMQIETRGENQEVNEMLMERVQKVIEGTALSFDVDYRVELAGGAPSYTIKDPDFIQAVSTALSERGFTTKSNNKLGGSEDVTYMMNEVENNGGKAIHFMFGTQIKGQPHHYKYDFGEEVLDFATRALAETALYLSDL